MDVVNWNAAVWSPTKQYKQEPLMELSVTVKCPICQKDRSLEYWQPLVPSHVKDADQGSYRRTTLKYCAERLADPRYCQSCGVSSIMPPAQLQELIEWADKEVTVDWLRDCVKQLGCITGTKTARAPLPDDYDYNVPAFIVAKGKSNQRLSRFPQSLPFKPITDR